MGKQVTIASLRREIEEEADADEAQRKAEDAAADEPLPTDGDETYGIGVVPREKPYRLEYRNPDTGKRTATTIIIAAPGKDDRELLGRFVEKFLGMPWLRASTLEQTRAYELAECAISIKDPPSWLFDALREDDDFREYVHGGVVAHATNFRFGDIPEGREKEVPPRFRLAPVEPHPPRASRPQR